MTAESNRITGFDRMEKPRPKQRRKASDDPQRAEPRAGLSNRGSLALVASALVAAVCLWFGRPASEPPAPTVTGAQSALAAPAQPEFEFLPIEDIGIHQRVVGRNPEVSDAERALFEDPDPAVCRLLTLVMDKPDGGRIDIQLSRDLAWIDETGAEVGATIDLDLAELGVAGPAQVVSIEPSPPLEPGADPVVTGTFKHTVDSVVEVQIEGLSEPIGVTPNHPFWSEDRQEFVPAGELRLGEQVYSSHADTTTAVTGLTRRGATTPVYNLEVDGEHVYCVSESGILVHNSCPLGKDGEGYASAWLKKNGYDVLGNMENRSGHGIDFIARNRASGRLTIVEVKTRSNGWGALSRRQRRFGSGGIAADISRKAARAEGHWSVHNRVGGTAHWGNQLRNYLRGGGTVDGLLLQINMNTRQIRDNPW